MFVIFAFFYTASPWTEADNLSFVGDFEVSSPMILTGYGALNKLLGKWLGCKHLVTSRAVFFCSVDPEGRNPRFRRGISTVGENDLHEGDEK